MSARPCPAPPPRATCPDRRRASRPRAWLRRHLLAALALLACAPAARAVTASEYEIKAAFLFNFVLFTDWPANVPPKGEPIVIGVLGEDPFGRTLDRIVGEQMAGHRPIIVRRFHRGEEVDGCQILYISRSEAAELPTLLERLRGKPVLTVSDLNRFAYDGGMIGLVVEQGRVRVQVNLGNTAGSGLSLGAKLLHIARIIRDPSQSMLRPDHENPQYFTVQLARLLVTAN